MTGSLPTLLTTLLFAAASLPVAQAHNHGAAFRLPADQRWSYDYAGGQLQRARSNEGQDFAYNHDAMGNRAGSSPNPANQYTVYRSMAGSGFTVAGSVAPGSEVYVRLGPPLPGPTLGGVPVTVNGDGSFRAHFNHPAGADPASVPVKVVAILRGAGTDGRDAVAREDHAVVLPPSEGASVYGPHGALAADPRWTYHWNAEGRLAGMETQAGAVNAGLAKVRLSFAYDAEGRRIWKQAEHFASDGQTVERTVVTTFVYDGWLLLGEFWTDTENGPGARYYTWGNDVSGTRGGAGGVGGLLAVTEAGGGTYTPAYDVAGAIVALVDTATGAEVAYWKRGPFGELLESGGAVEKCPMGFATHYTDQESGLVYFGHRFYSPATGRWLSREPLGEMESFNLYAYCHNDPVGKVDVLGLHEFKVDEGTGELVLLIEKTNWLWQRKPAGEHVLGKVVNRQNELEQFEIGFGYGGGELDPSTIKWYLDNKLDDAVPNLSEMSEADQAAALATFLQLVRVEEMIYNETRGKSTGVPLGVRLVADQNFSYIDNVILGSDFVAELNPLVSAIAAGTGESPSGRTQYGGGERAVIGATSLPGAKLAGAGFAGVAYVLSKIGKVDGLVDDGIRLGGAALGAQPSKAIVGTRGLNHSFDRHAHEWFGRMVPTTTHLDKWHELVERAAQSSKQVPWRTGADDTVGHLARIDGKYFFVQFFQDGPRAGELATAFVPSQKQLAKILKLLKQ